MIYSERHNDVLLACVKFRGIAENEKGSEKKATQRTQREDNPPDPVKLHIR